MRKLVLALFILALVSFGIYRAIKSPQRRPTPATTVRNPLGVGLGIGFADRPEEEFERTLTMLEENGCRWVRVGVRWDEVEKKQGVYDWAAIDRMAAAMEKHHITWLMNLNISVPKWANNSKNSRLIPQDPSAYAAFAKAVATHLPNQRYYEISNLPNTDGNWDPAPSAAAYTAYLREAYTAIKAVRPDSVILSGGLGYNEMGPKHPNNIPGSVFLAQMYQAGAKPYFDVVSFHTYWWPGYEPFGYGQLQKAIPIMKENGDEAKPIWITEFGPPSEDVGLEGQAKLLHEQYNTLSAFAQVRNILWHDFRDASTPEDLDNKTSKGLLQEDFTPKPAWAAFTAITKNQ